MRVVAALSREGTERMAERIGNDIVRVEAEAAGAQADGWNLRLIRAWDRSGREYPWAREAVSFPRAYVTQLEQRELDQRRSWRLAGAVTVGAVLLGRTFLKSFFGDDDTGNGTDPPQ